jgi:hypothetical protein
MHRDMCGFGVVGDDTGRDTRGVLELVRVSKTGHVLVSHQSRRAISTRTLARGLITLQVALCGDNNEARGLHQPPSPNLGCGDEGIVIFGHPSQILSTASVFTSSR